MSGQSTATGSLMTADTEADGLRRTRLRRMQAVALGLLVFAAVVYVADARTRTASRAS